VQQQLGITTLFETHDHEEAVMMADRVALLLGGVLQQVDAPRALYEEPAATTVARFFRHENLLPGRCNGPVTETALGAITTAMAPPAPNGPVVLTVERVPQSV
jgi:spermidine/putrescine transport system ATP-binding protein